MVAASRWSWPGRATLAVPATVNASAAGLAPGANRRADPTATAARRIRRSTHEDELRLRASAFTEDAGRAVSPDRATIIRTPRDRDDRGVARGPTETVLGLVLG